jgi:hypothetical protein
MQVKIRFVALMGLTSLAACGVSEDEFREQYRETICSLVMECQSDDDFIVFDSQGDCELFLTLFTSGTHGDDCEYDKKQGKECLGDLVEASCETDTVPSCEDVFIGDCGYWGADEYSDTGA